MALTLEEFSDRELLFALEEHADGDGLVSSQDLAEGLGLNERLKHATQSVAIRLSWMKRYGVVRRDDDTGRWGLTPAGERVIHGTLRATQRRALDDLDDERLWAAMQLMGNRMINAQGEAAILAARQWRYAIAERKRNRGGRF